MLKYHMAIYVTIQQNTHVALPKAHSMFQWSNGLY